MKNKRIFAFALTLIVIISLASSLYISGNAANEYLTLKDGSTLKLYSRNGVKYVSGIPFDTKSAALALNFKGTVKTTNNSGNVLKDVDILVNGDRITLMSSGDTAYVIVHGDSESNGKLTIADYLRIKRHFTGTFTLTGIDLEAADVNSDGMIGTDDYLAIKVHFKNGIIIDSSFTNKNIKDDSTTPTKYTLPFIPA